MFWFQWIIVVLSLATVASMVWYGIGFAPFVPSDVADIDRGLRLAGIMPGERLSDLGSGDGRVVRRAAKHFGAKAVGYEGVLGLYLYAQIRQWLRPLPGVSFRHVNFITAPCDMAEVVYLYGIGSTITKTVWPKLVAEMPAGTRIVSMRFPITGVEPARTDISAGRGYRVFLYIIPPK